MDNANITADYRDDAAPEPEPVKPKRGADLRRWAIDHAPRGVLVGRFRPTGGPLPHRWNREDACFELRYDGDGWERCDIDDDEEGVPESGTWESGDE